MNFYQLLEFIELRNSVDLNGLKAMFLEIIYNILRDPENELHRKLKKSDLIRMEPILSLQGGREMLQYMGFKENESEFYIDCETSTISHLIDVKDDLEIWKPTNRMVSSPSRQAADPVPHVPSESSNLIEPIRVPLFEHKFANPFLRKMAVSLAHSFCYDDLELRRKARMSIPYFELIKKAEVRHREMESRMRCSQDTKDLTLPSMQNFMLLELLEWFHDKYFKWMDKPNCQYCLGLTQFSHMSSDHYTRRIENYRCISCGKYSQFGRYDDLNILLETRTGRCGESANLFTLMCRSLNWDARLVVDETDHVWTEVYCPIQKRWIHCDPCENVCDTPLMYENGWKKQLTYVIAYSRFELQDVTWRYSSNHKELLKRRKACSEYELIAAMFYLRGKTMRGLQQHLIDYYTIRIVGDLAEMSTERKPNDNELAGRTSGSLDWRLARGETEEAQWTSYSFGMFENQLKKTEFRLLYSCAKNEYQTIGDGAIGIQQWYNGIYSQKNMMRKVERDWKQVYLCRKEGTKEGHIAWRFFLRDTKKLITSFKLKLDTKTFHSGTVAINISNQDGVSLDLSRVSGEELREFEKFRGSKAILITVTLSGGEGDLAWQHSQIFRQSLDSEEYPFEVYIAFE